MGSRFRIVGLFVFCLSVYMLVAQLCPALCDPVDCCLPSSFYPWNSPGKNTGVGSHSLLQGLFPVQGSNLILSCCRQILYHLRHLRKPNIYITIYLFSLSDLVHSVQQKLIQHCKATIPRFKKEKEE